MLILWVFLAAQAAPCAKSCGPGDKDCGPELGILWGALTKKELQSVTQPFALKAVVINPRCPASQLIRDDEVLLAVDGTELTGYGTYNTFLCGHKPGDQATLTMLRNGQPEDVGVVIQNDARKGKHYCYIPGGPNDPMGAGGPMVGPSAAPAAATTTKAAALAAGPLLVNSGRLAVLELSGGLNRDELGVLSDEMRGAVVGTVGTGVQVMTRENMEVMLEDMGLNADCVSEGACEVETARNLGVDYVISGSIVKMGQTFVLSIKLHEVRNGQLLGAKSIRGTDGLALLDGVVAATATLLGKPE